MAILKNYTSGVPVIRTVARIEQLLSEAGATNVSKSYVNGQLECITFGIQHNGKLIQFRLPADAKKIFDAMWKEVSRPRPETKKRIAEQSERTAWKLLQDSLEIECTRLRLNQTEFLQVFLSYVWDGKQTYFDALKSQGFRAMLKEKNE